MTGNPVPVDDEGWGAYLQNLHAEYGPALERTARRLCRTPQDAEDLVQETWARASRGLRRAERIRQEGAWLHAVLRNLVIDRGRRLRTMAEEPLRHDPPTPIREPMPRWRTVTTEEHLAPVEALSRDLRTTYRLFLQGHRYRDIASILRVEENTVASRLFRARARLRGLLERAGTWR